MTSVKGIEQEIRHNDVFRLIKLKKLDALPQWCRHNILFVRIIRGEPVFFDTYWGGTPESLYTVSKLEEVQYLGNLDDYDEQPRNWDGSDYDWSDRITFPMGGYPQRDFLRKGAQKSRILLILNAIEALEKAESDVRQAESRVLWETEEFRKLIQSTTDDNREKTLIALRNAFRENRHRHENIYTIRWQCLLRDLFRGVSGNPVLGDYEILDYGQPPKFGEVDS